mgnify:CR=1 FL=1
MYCPKCSQQQVADEIRFCPKCGLPLDAVRSLLNDEQTGSLIAYSDAPATSTRKKDVIIGASAMMLIALVIMLLAVSSAAPVPTFAVVVPLLILWAFLVSGVLLSRHALDEVRKLFFKEPAQLHTEEQNLITSVTGRNRELAVGVGQPIEGLWKTATAELEPIPSVTEETTGLLDKDKP